MGEVYRARDTRLKRDVALKVLSAAFARDVDRLARFQREAELLATLNHPNIAAVYGLEESGGLTAIVLELVDGATLAQRLRARPMPIDQALAIARQMADALQAAHAKGILHRDLKPANIALTADDQVKVLDFGLAKAIETESSSDVANSPTYRAAVTETGVVMGTASYMSPEQAQGRGVDKRGDVWAFGCVLFEMLTGTRAFQGDTASETLAAILRDDPDWTALPPTVPAWLRALLLQCLVKDRRQRVADISVVAYVLDGGVTASGPASVSPVGRGSAWRVATWSLAALVIVMAGILAWTALGVAPAPPARVLRFAVVAPPAQPFVNSGGPDPDVLISPAGTHIVYASATDPADVIVRALDRLEGVPLRGLGATRHRFMSPDGQWLGYVDDKGGELKKVLIAGGSPPVTICRVKTNGISGAAWLDDDTIVFAQVTGGGGLWRVPAAGGEPRQVTEAGSNLNAASLAVLPDGRGVLFTTPSYGDIKASSVGVLDLRTGATKTLVQGAARAVYMTTGHLIYAVPGALRAARFDLQRLEIKGEPQTVVDGIVTTTRGGANFSVSTGGTLVYVPGGVIGGSPDSDRLLVRISRQGQEERLTAPRRRYTNPRLSPDGSRLALEIRGEDPPSRIWVYDVGRQTLTPLSPDAARDSSARAPLWTPDGGRIAFLGGPRGQPGIFWQSADGAAPAERLTTTATGVREFPVSFSPDGLLVLGVVTVVQTPGNPDRSHFQNAIETLELKGERRRRQIVQFRGDGPWISAQLSPDGKWIAYVSDESSLSAVYVRPFPDVEAGRWQISGMHGGVDPLWSRTGNELFYRQYDGQLMAVPIRLSPAFSAGSPAALFDTRTRYPVQFYGRSYDVTLDGRFIMLADEGSSTLSTPASFVVVQNWFEELKARVPR